MKLFQRCLLSMITTTYCVAALCVAARADEPRRFASDPRTGEQRASDQRTNSANKAESGKPASNKPADSKIESSKISGNINNSDSGNKVDTGYVAVSRALVYSGPSEDYYPTHQLAQGTAVEIYHQSDSGWMAIRPPSGSFSWIPATDAYLLPGGRSVEITSKNSVSWIGSSLGTAKQYRWQVQLNPGEQLTKLGEESIKDKEGKETLWYKIAPPNGEFRWIQKSAVSQQPPEKLVREDAIAKSAVVPASGQSKKSDKRFSNVKNASHSARQEEVGAIALENSSPDSGVIIDDGYAGEIIDDGETIVDGEYIDGDYMGDEGYIVSEDEVPQHDANWKDWQLFELTDQGLRLPFLERAAAWRNTQPDPLAADPFSLDMAPKKKGNPRPGYQEPVQAVPNRRYTPWRDPRKLSEQRMMGYPQASGERGMGTTVSALRGTLDDTRETIQNNFGGGSAFDGARSSRHMDSMPGSYNGSSFNAPEPRAAPTMDWSTTLQGNRNSNSMGPSVAATNVSAPGLGGGSDNFASSGTLPGTTSSTSASASSASWNSRNWFGFTGRSESADRTSALEAGSNAVFQLQQRLSEMVTRPMQQWNFGELKDKVQYYISNGSSPTERGQARLLLERIGEFERHAMKSGYSLSSLNSGSTLGGPPVSSVPAVGASSFSAGAFSGSANGGSFVSNPTSPTTAPVVTASFAAPATGSGSDTIAAKNFDATGWLVPVHAAQPGQPTHALTSDSGQIIAYVTALPGMNLDRFVNQAVGIHGLRGYLNEFRAAHIEAQNVTRLR